MEIRSPIDGQVIDDVVEWSGDEVDDVLRDAAASQRTWGARDATERGRILRRVADLIRENATELAELESRNTGKIIADTSREVERAAGTFEYYGGWADKVYGRTIPVPGPYHTYTDRVPLGVAVGIIPWNVPFFFAAKKMAPALAFGNASIVKPAPETPLTALWLRSLVIEAGVPEGVAHVVVGGAEVGRALIGSPHTDLIVFTGHPDTGRKIARQAADRLIPSALELGGKSPQIVFPDADLDAAADAISLGVFSSCGQMCVAGSRLLVHEEVHSELLERLAARTAALNVGDPFDPAVEVGPHITAAQKAKTERYIERGVQEGARMVAQAQLPTAERLRDGYYVRPTLFDGVTPEMVISREEIFGPVLAVATFRDEKMAIELANDTPFGLAAGVWTTDVARAHATAAQLRVGNVWINTYRVLSDLVPFGGFGHSGYGRENGEEAVGLYTTTRATWTALRAGRPAGYTG